MHHSFITNSRNSAKWQGANRSCDYVCHFRLCSLIMQISRCTYIIIRNNSSRFGALLPLQNAFQFLSIFWQFKFLLLLVHLTKKTVPKMFPTFSNCFDSVYTLCIKSDGIKQLEGNTDWIRLSVWESFVCTSKVGCGM